jgi:hypothetical protein
MTNMPSLLFPTAFRMTHKLLTPKKATSMAHPIPVPARPAFRLVAGRLLFAALGLLALNLLPGCGPGVAEVSGKVYYKGKIITSGQVTMIGNDGIPKYSEIAEDGSYQIPGVSAGEVKIAVSSPALDASKGRPLPKRPGDDGRKTDDPGANATENQKKTWREIPIVYSDITKSNLKHTVTRGANTYDIKLD